MSFKAGFLLIALLAGSYAFPAKDDMSIYFDQTDSSARIIGGKFAGNIPYIVALVSGISVRSLICGGTLVTTRHVLTTANCIQAATSGNNLISSFRGIVDITFRFDRFGTAHSFSERIVHPDYNARTMNNNIGLLVTSSNVELKAGRVTLAPLNFDFVGAGIEVTAAGYGIRSTGTVSQNLQQLNTTTVDGEFCRNRVRERAQGLRLPGTPPVDPEVEICTAGTFTTSVCRGDFGGPLIRTDSRQQIGILSWGLAVSRCSRNAPDVSVRLSVYRSWIEQNTQ